MTEFRLMDEHWDILIVLDACRYDYFAAAFGKYFGGKLEKRTSPGSTTLEWCEKSFINHYPDTLYISGNPYIGSKTQYNSFAAKDHFAEVLDIWNKGWNHKLGTVLPEDLNRATLSSIDKSPELRCIVHYMQPHEPYISKQFAANGFPAPFTIGPLSGLQGGNTKIERFVNILSFLLIKSKIYSNPWKLREKLRLPPANPMDATRRKYGVDGLREAYRQNLEIVLKYVARLCDEILTKYPTRRIVITADHGDFLGEDGKYSHVRGWTDLLLTEIPWFEVETINSVPDSSNIAELFEQPVSGLGRTRTSSRIQKLRESGKV